jgi:2-methylisocitrate lyase-like PEP mutase family enzyme
VAVGPRYGVPDIGLKGFGEISACVRDIIAACDLPVLVDGDDGYGDVKDVVHMVHSLTSKREVSHTATTAWILSNTRN